MISEYQILSNDTIEQLEQNVRDAIGLGWQPLGGVATASEITDDNEQIFYYLQAIGK